MKQSHKKLKFIPYLASRAALSLSIQLSHLLFILCSLLSIITPVTFIGSWVMISVGLKNNAEMFFHGAVLALASLLLNYTAHKGEKFFARTFVERLGYLVAENNIKKPKKPKPLAPKAREDQTKTKHSKELVSPLGFLEYMKHKQDNSTEDKETPKEEQSYRSSWGSL